MRILRNVRKRHFAGKNPGLAYTSPYWSIMEAPTQRGSETMLFSEPETLL